MEHGCREGVVRGRWHLGVGRGAAVPALVIWSIRWHSRAEPPAYPWTEWFRFRGLKVLEVTHLPKAGPVKKGKVPDSTSPRAASGRGNLAAWDLRRCTLVLCVTGQGPQVLGVWSGSKLGHPLSTSKYPWGLEFSLDGLCVFEHALSTSNLPESDLEFVSSGKLRLPLWMNH